jgi:hypothetical protein
MELFLRLPKIVGSREYVIDGKTTRDIYEGEVPKEMDDYAKAVMGDGQARVAVTTDMGFKDYGNGVSVSVTLSMSCNQDVTTVNNTVQFLGSWSREYCKQQLAIADQEYQKLFYSKYPEKAPLPTWTPPGQ